MKKFLILVLILFSINICYGAKNTDVKKPVSQSTSKENAIRRQNFNMCIASGKPRSYCYYLFY